ncbi:SCP2 sterol-binding domain-containing protein [Hydrogenophaga sp. PAMC20947]|uniref:ubiquinone anaerobic biosynthesis accessory factor UbiT n=1 Tax=Hydrogenophaga sp. PAMC20947 TaxID=2565558 RepID=UPI00109DD9D5|nr:SCP2 sterol-binding domain-containing protein [Hydrogenophaga sp. PAMC20947]QCB47840.1 sterol-binding protein [Hydrogenophaga sp. PAMC20947]
MTLHTTHPTVPAPIGSALARLPAFPGSLLLVTGLNLVLARQLPGDVTQVLLNKRFRIEVRDARLNFDFVWRGGRFRPASPEATAPDLTLSANAHDFVRLARRLDDPDTLFFNRRLSMQGDTELGLVVKNALDAMELPVLDLAAWKPSAVLARFKGPRTTRAPSFHERH